MLLIEMDSARSAIYCRCGNWLLKMLLRLLHLHGFSFHPGCEWRKRQRLRKADQLNTGNLKVSPGWGSAALNRLLILMIGIHLKSKAQEPEHGLIRRDIDWVAELIGDRPSLLSIHNPQKDLLCTALINDERRVDLNVSGLPEVVKEWVRTPQLLQMFLECILSSVLRCVRNQIVRTGEVNQRPRERSLNLVEVALCSMGAHFLQRLHCPANSSVCRFAALFRPLPI